MFPHCSVRKSQEGDVTGPEIPVSWPCLVWRWGSFWIVGLGSRQPRKICVIQSEEGKVRAVNQSEEGKVRAKATVGSLAGGKALDPQSTVLGPGEVEFLMPWGSLGTALLTSCYGLVRMALF